MTTGRKIVIAADHAGIALKAAIVATLAGQGHDVTDLGTHTNESVHYPDFANLAVKAVLAKPASLGILICGSGIGMSIAANRHKGIRAALCQSVEAATLSRQHNDANILCLGARLVSEATALACVDAFVATDFEGGRHIQRVEMLG